MSNSFKDWTPAQVDAHNAKVSGARAKAPIGGQSTEPEMRAPVPQIELSSRPNTDEQKLNKLERAYLSHLRMLKVPCLRIQQQILKLADDCRLTVDFTYVNADGRLTFVDVKGFQREDALLKMKFAARTFTEYNFVIVTKENGQWVETPIKP